MCHCQPVSNTTGDVFETRLSMTANLFRFGKIMNALYKKYVNETGDGTNVTLNYKKFFKTCRCKLPIFSPPYRMTGWFKG